MKKYFKYYIVLILFLVIINFEVQAETNVSGDASGDAVSQDNLKSDIVESLNTSDFSESQTEDYLMYFDTIIEKLTEQSQLLNDVSVGQRDLSDTIKDILDNKDASGDASSVEPVEESLPESLKDVAIHNFVLPEEEISDNKLLKKIYNLLLLIFCFLILQFLYQEAKALFNKLHN